MLARGVQVDRYEVERLLGMGGMAEVWAARHLVLGVRRALKFMLRESRAASSGDLVTEGQLQARLDHPNVLAVLDVVEHEGSPVLVLPLVEGPTLAQLLRWRPLTVGEGASIMAGVLAGVQAAHLAGVVHRDLKPSNVLLELRGGAAGVGLRHRWGFRQGGAGDRPVRRTGAARGRRGGSPGRLPRPGCDAGRVAAGRSAGGPGGSRRAIMPQ